MVLQGTESWVRGTARDRKLGTVLQGAESWHGTARGRKLAWYCKGQKARYGTARGRKLARYCMQGTES